MQRQHRNMVAVTVEQTVDEVQVSCPQEPAQTASSPVSQFGTGGKGGDFFMAGGHPLIVFILLRLSLSPPENCQ